MIALDHIQLAIPAGGEQRARAFWTGLPGLAEIDKPEALLWDDNIADRKRFFTEDPFGNRLEFLA